MDLIKRLYKENDEIEKVIVLFDTKETCDKLMCFLDVTRIFDTDLYAPEVSYNIENIFSRLGIGLNKNIYLTNMKIGPSRYKGYECGYCTFNYLFGSKTREDNTITYYSSNELFPGEKYAAYPGVKLSSGNESLYYSVGSVPIIRKYSIELNNDVTITREYLNDEVLFIIEGRTNHLVIKVKKPVSKVVESYYQLDNEMALLDYLKTLTGSYDVIDIYDNLCKLSLGSNVSMYQEITVCDSVKNNYGICNNNVLSVRNGEINSVVRTVGDKIITLSGNGNWSYTLSDEYVDFRINSGKTMKYHIETKSEKEMDDYTDELLRYDVSAAKREVEQTRELVRKRCKLENKRG